LIKKLYDESISWDWKSKQETTMEWMEALEPTWKKKLGFVVGKYKDDSS
jgi:hypothetical protein